MSKHEKNIEKIKELKKIIHEQKLWIDERLDDDWKEICKGDSD